jgi:transcription initiation factor TFIIIB Brf1 subunit/transcription initiation factor TFIIB
MSDVISLMTLVREKNKDIKPTIDGCPSCKTLNIGDINGQRVCLACGITLEACVDFRPEWRTDHDGIETSHCNIARNDMLPESSMSTCIVSGKGSSKLVRSLKRSMTWNSVPHSERALRIRIEDITYHCTQAGIRNAVIDEAHKLYYKILEAQKEHDMVSRRGNKDKGLKAAAVFYALQNAGKPQSAKEVARIFSIEPKFVSESLKTFDELIKPEQRITIYKKYIDTFCEALDMAQYVARVAEVADLADKMGILENSTPISMVGGCIYYVAVEQGLSGVTPKTISSRCEVSVPTINKVCDKLSRHSRELLSQLS